MNHHNKKLKWRQGQNFWVQVWNTIHHRQTCSMTRNSIFNIVRDNYKRHYTHWLLCLVTILFYLCFSKAVGKQAVFSWTLFFWQTLTDIGWHIFLWWFSHQWANSHNHPFRTRAETDMRFLSKLLQKLPWHPWQSKRPSRKWLFVCDGSVSAVGKSDVW